MSQFEPGQHGRFRKLPSLTKAPGVCSFFRTHKEDWFLDTSLDVDGLPGGGVFIGATAFRDLAKAAGFRSEEDFETELERLGYLEGRCHELEAAMERFGDLFDELDRFGMLGDGMRERVRELRSSSVENVDNVGGNEPTLDLSHLTTPESDSESRSDDPDAATANDGNSDRGPSQG